MIVGIIHSVYDFSLHIILIALGIVEYHPMVSGRGSLLYPHQVIGMEHIIVVHTSGKQIVGITMGRYILFDNSRLISIGL